MVYEQDQGGYRITLTHHQDKEELNDSFITTAKDYERCVAIVVWKCG